MNIRKWLFCLHLFIGIGAVFGGLAAILDPSGESVGMTTEALKYGPFKDFLIPGLFLFIVLGLGNLICSVMIKLRFKYQPYLSGLFGLILVLWITIQCLVMLIVVWLHVIFFVLGFILLLLGIQLIKQEKLFPFKRL